MMDFTGSSEPVLIASGKTRLAGVLELPPNPSGLVLYTRDSGVRHPSSGSSHFVNELRRAGLASLRLEPPGLDKHGSDANRFDLGLLGSRLSAATDWLAAEAETRALMFGLFGTGAEAAAALQIAARRPEHVAAVVARGGRLDLADADALSRVRAPTLLIVGEDDGSAITYNRRALNQLGCEKDLAVIRGATYPTAQPGVLQEAARLAVRWFKGYLGGATRLMR
jgi:putative phosphoribosyl transferase